MKRFIGFCCLMVIAMSTSMVMGDKIDGSYKLKAGWPVDHGGLITYTYDGHSDQTYPGIVPFDLEDSKDGANPNLLPDDIYGACIQLDATIYINSSHWFDLYSQLEDIPDIDNNTEMADEVRRLSGNYFDDAINNSTVDDVVGNGSSNNVSPALQVAIWEVIYDGGGSDDFVFNADDGGDFYINDQTLANDAYDLYDKMSQDIQANMMALYDDSTQNFALFIETVQDPGGNMDPIPLPPSMAMTLMGLVGIGGFGWVRRRRG